MKLHTLLLLLCAAVPVAVPSKAASLDSLGFDPSSQSVNVGDTFTVSLDIGQLTQEYVSCGAQCFVDVSSLYAWQVEIDFDPNVFQALEVDEGTFLPATGSTTFFSGFTDNTDGSVSFILESLEGATSGADTELNGGQLLTVLFQAIAPSVGSAISVAPGSCFQTYVDLGTSDCSISSFLDTSAVATVSANAVAPTPEPSLRMLTPLLLSAMGLVYRWRDKTRRKGSLYRMGVAANRFDEMEMLGSAIDSLNGIGPKLREPL